MSDYTALLSCLREGAEAGFAPCGEAAAAIEALQADADELRSINNDLQEQIKQADITIEELAYRVSHPENRPLNFDPVIGRPICGACNGSGEIGADRDIGLSDAGIGTCPDCNGSGFSRAASGETGGTKDRHD